jgi:hypothetical protein
MNSVIALQTSIWLIIGWFLLFWCWRQYRIDALRQTLFELRDELFDFAAEGHVSFSDEVYVRNRKYLNTMIRFAHRATFTSAAVAALFAKDSLAKVRTPPEEVLAMPKSDTKEKLLSIHRRANSALFTHIVTASPLPVVALGGIIVHLAVRGMLRAYSERVGSDRTVATIERLAMASEAA